jgi:UDP-N-acetylglucosamine acyltransferase
MANAATLAGHVTVYDRANIGAYSGVHEFCRVGREAYIGGYSVVVKDALPFALTVGNHAKCYGFNKVSVRRRGHSKETIAALHHAFHLLLSQAQHHQGDRTNSRGNKKWGKLMKSAELR